MFSPLIKQGRTIQFLFLGGGRVVKFGQCKNLFSPLIKQGRTIQFLFFGGGEGCKIWSVQELVFPTNKTRPHHSIFFFLGGGGVGKFGQCKNLFSPLIKQGRTIQFLFFLGGGVGKFGVRCSFALPTSRINYRKFSLKFQGPKTWKLGFNNLNNNLKSRLVLSCARKCSNVFDSTALMSVCMTL